MVLGSYVHGVCGIHVILRVREVVLKLTVTNAFESRIMSLIWLPPVPMSAPTDELGTIIMRSPLHAWPWPWPPLWPPPPPPREYSSLKQSVSLQDEGIHTAKHQINKLTLGGWRSTLGSWRHMGVASCHLDPLVPCRRVWASWDLEVVPKKGTKNKRSLLKFNKSVNYLDDLMFCW